MVQRGWRFLFAKPDGYGLAEFPDFGLFPNDFGESFVLSPAPEDFVHRVGSRGLASVPESLVSGFEH